MKAKKRILSFLFIMVLVVTMAVPALAKDKNYSYTIRVFAGNKGNFNGNASWEATYKYGEHCTINLADLGLIIDNNEKYYALGIKEAGEDNNNLAVTSFDVTEDMDFTVAYGVYGNRATVIIKYVDENGNELLPQDVTYGNAGDKPIVGSRYIEGMEPDAYNRTRTLKAGDNVFTFIYKKQEAVTPNPDDSSDESSEESSEESSNESSSESSDSSDSSTGNESSDSSDSNTDNSSNVPQEDESSEESGRSEESTEQESSEESSAAEGQDSEESSEESSGPEEIIDEDENPPKADYDDSTENVDKSGDTSGNNGLSVGAWVGIGAGAAAVLAVIIAVLLKKRKK